MTVRELKAWHIPILSYLLVNKMDNSLKGRLIKILSEKATNFATDPTYSLLIISFIRINSPFTDEQKSMLAEISAVNKSKHKDNLNAYCLKII